MTEFFEKKGGMIIKSCEAGEISDVMDFYRITLGESSILSHDKKFVSWQYFDKNAGNYNFLCARNQEDNRLDGVLGFIPNSLFDEKIELDSQSDFLWLSNWSVSENAKNGTGLKLIQTFHKLYNGLKIGSTGVSDTAVGLYSLMGYKSDILRHFYMLSDTVSDFKLIKNPPAKKSFKTGEDRFSFHFVKEPSVTGIFDDTFKTPEFFINKYAKHPYYEYKLYNVTDGNGIKGTSVFRISEHNGGRLLRHIDFCGDASCFLYMDKAFQKLISDNGCEALEFYAYGLYLSEAGFFDMSDTEDTVVPYHFEPYAEKNVRINYVYKTITPRYVFKGDNDRERPGVIRKPWKN